MTPTPSTESSIIDTVNPSSTVMDMTTPAIGYASLSCSCCTCRHPIFRDCSPWQSVETAPELVNLLLDRKSQRLFVHGTRAPLTSRTRGFVQHVV